jgi:hypothetical protein
MKKTFLNIGTFICFLAFTLASCNTGSIETLDNQSSLLGVNITQEQLPTDSNEEESNEEMTITVPIQEHEIRIVRAKNEQKEAKLSDANVKELESWWDSLPIPVQSQIISNQIDIEVVSSIRTKNIEDINEKLNDSQIENTGETLVQIIGKDAEMKYTVNTTLIGSENNTETEGGEHSTNIRLVKHVPVKLQQFSTDVFLREKTVSNDNIRTLQYWWTNLPEDIQYKIKTKELILDVTCHSISDMDDASGNDLAAAQEYAAIVGDVLNRMAGVYKIDKKEHSLAIIQTTAKLEKANVKNLKYPAKQYVKIGLRKNKSFVADVP